MANYQSLYTGAEIDEAVGRALPNGAIDTSLSNKADVSDHNLRTYTSLEQLDLSDDSTIAQISAAMPNGSTLKYAIKPTDTSIYPNSVHWGNCTVNKSIYNFCTWAYEIIVESENDVYTGVSFDVNSETLFSGWTPIATATTPTEYDLPLAEGVSTGAYPPKYYKDGAGMVSIAGTVKPTTQLISGQSIATLPAGYRPIIQIPIVLLDTNGKTALGYISNSGNGNVAIIGGSLPDGFGGTAPSISITHAPFFGN